MLEAQNVIALQSESDEGGRYDWGPSVMKDGALYKMWWVRLGGAGTSQFTHSATRADGTAGEVNYPDHGDRIYYAESRDGRAWHADGADYAGDRESYGPGSDGSLLVLGPAETPDEYYHVGTPSVIKVNSTYYMYYEAPGGYAIRHRNGSDGAVTGQEYHNQIFVAVSPDGKVWRKDPAERAPEPIVAAPKWNHQKGKQFYGLGQPSVYYRDGVFVMHYVDSCNGYLPGGVGDVIVRLEADNPYFKGAKCYPKKISLPGREAVTPAGAVARWAQTDIKYHGGVELLIRPAYGAGRLGIQSSADGIFGRDADRNSPAEVYPQINVADPRGPGYRERLFPDFLTDPHGEVVVEHDHVVIYFSSGAGFTSKANSWNLCRCEIPVKRLQTLLQINPQSWRGHSR